MILVCVPSHRQELRLGTERVTVGPTATIEETLVLATTGRPLA